MHEVVEHESMAWVPGNRWDLVRIDHGPVVDVAVIVPHFEQPESLRRMYAAIVASRLPADRYELIVVDDGSTLPPPPPPDDFPLPATTLRQPDLGRRPGQARNLGVTATAADILVFLDVDTLPEPDTIERLAAWPARIPDVLVAGRRRHADLTGWTPAATTDWLAGCGPAPNLGRDPEWLADGLRRSDNLLHIDRRSYRYVISAVMACRKMLFDDIGGFADDRAEYGGEDWELASRALVNGAVLAHDPLAIAWHDEPDWSERKSDPKSKNAETMWLASTIPDPSARGTGIRHRDSAVLVDLDVAAGASAAQLVVTIDSILSALCDVAVRLPADAPTAVVHHVGDDPRVTRDPFSVLQRRRSSLGVELHAPAAWDPKGLRRLVDELQGSTDRVVVVCDGPLRVATLTPSGTDGRRRRAVQLGMADADVRRLVRTEERNALTVGLRMCTSEVDLAAHFRRR